MELPGPSGRRQSAPATQRHHCDKSSSGTACGVGVKTRAPGVVLRSAGRGVPGGSCFFISSQSGVFSAVVT